MRPQDSDGKTDCRHVYEILFSVNVAFAAMVVLFGRGPETLVSWLYGLNSSIRSSLHLEQTDLATNGFVFFIFALALTMVIWVCLRFYARGAWPIAAILPFVSGVASIDAVPLVWSFGHTPWAHAWYLPDVIQFVEAGLVVVCLYLFLHRRWPVPIWACLTIVIIHFAFWFRTFGFFDGFESAYHHRRLRISDLLIPHGAPAASVIALGSALIWLFCVTRSRAAAASS